MKRFIIALLIVVFAAAFDNDTYETEPGIYPSYIYGTPCRETVPSYDWYCDAEVVLGGNSANFVYVQTGNNNGVWHPTNQFVLKDQEWNGIVPVEVELNVVRGRDHSHVRILYSGHVMLIELAEPEPVVHEPPDWAKTPHDSREDAGSLLRDLLGC